MININSKTPNTKESIFAVMSSLASDYKAINLSQGFPGYPIDPILIDLVSHYMKEGFNQYAPMPGILQLRNSISELHFKATNFKYNPESEITITAGATQGLFTSISGIVNEDDEVIVFEPAYDSYVPVIIANGGKPIFISLAHPTYHINWDEVARRISSKTRMIIINNPHNPTGAVWSEDDLKELEKIVKGTNIIILSDEVYQHIIFDNLKHQSVSLIKNLRERSIIVGSFGKSLHATGWKIGYVLAPDFIMKHIRSYHQWVVFAVNTPIQMAIAEYIKNENNYLTVSNFLQEKRNLFLQAMSKTRLKPITCNGTYFQLMDYSMLSNKPDVEYAEWLTKELKVATVPVSVFYHEKTDYKVLRFCFAKENEELLKAAKLLEQL